MEVRVMCTERETFQVKHDSFNVHKKVKKLTGTYRRRQITTLTNTENAWTPSIQSRYFKHVPAVWIQDDYFNRRMSGSAINVNFA